MGQRHQKRTEITKHYQTTTFVEEYHIIGIELQKRPTLQLSFLLFEKIPFFMMSFVVKCCYVNILVRIRRYFLA